MTSHQRKTPEQATLGHGAPGDPERMETDVPGPRYLDVPVAVEKTDAEARTILRWGAGLAALGLFGAVAAFGVFRLFANLERRNDPPPPPLARAEGRTFPEPRLQTTPLSDLDALRARDREALTGAAWVDEAGGTARVPIEDAIALYVQAASTNQPLPMAAVVAPSPSPSPAGQSR